MKTTKATAHTFYGAVEASSSDEKDGGKLRPSPVATRRRRASQVARGVLATSPKVDAVRTSPDSTMLPFYGDVDQRSPKEEAAMCIQALVRGIRLRNERKRRTLCATHIQTQFRGNLARRELSLRALRQSEEYKALVVAAATAAKAVAAVEAEMALQVLSATHIQNHFRGNLARRQMRDACTLKEKELAGAVLLQTAWRGRQARRRRDYLQAQRELAKKEAAALVLINTPRALKESYLVYLDKPTDRNIDDELAEVQDHTDMVRQALIKKRHARQVSRPGGGGRKACCGGGPADGSCIIA